MAVELSACPNGHPITDLVGDDVDPLSGTLVNPRVKCDQCDWGAPVEAVTRDGRRFRVQVPDAAFASLGDELAT